METEEQTRGKSDGETQLLNSLFDAMVKFDAADSKRIQHFVKVHAFARRIAQGEGADAETLFITEAAAYVHDIGIKPAERKYGSCSGKLQEQEGPAPARAMLEDLGFQPHVIDRVCYLVGHHHTYSNIDGLDYQALVEADFLVNMYEDGVSQSAVQSALRSIFRTETGTRLCKTMFGVA